mmetsp:Transcript_76694/g.225143  ORF Transcript_76694/g.225143 Transcript_76694/m.225143 type:complete len:720 (+) Transcript_76694:424-2583(+)
MASHGCPPFSGYFLIRRVRSIWPLHLVQAPQSLQSPYSQSTDGGPSHSARAHSRSSESAPWHGFPPNAGCCATTLLRACWPPPQEVVHSLHSSQSAKRQLMASPEPQPAGASSCGPGLQGQVSFSAPAHHLPSPLPYVPTRLERRVTPSQLAEQSDQLSHSVSTQSTGASQATCTLQNRTSEFLPSGSSPHSFAVRTMRRVRPEVPPPQVAVHLDQGSHSPNSPSMQCAGLHSCVLQGSTCSFSETAQGFPPSLGDLRMWRSRVRWPPPQEQEQPPHWVQSSHSQSTPQGGLSGHCLASDRAMSQPMPPALRRLTTSRERVCRPTPQLAEHWPHSCQPLTWQSSLLQGWVLQPLVWTSSWGHVLPPFSGKWWTWRCRCVCPPPQSRSHSSHCVHSETRQSTAFFLQVSVSCMAPLQSLPPRSESWAMLRSRKRWLSKPQSDHWPHAPNSQLTDEWLKHIGSSAQQWSIISRSPSHWPPPRRASCRRLRERLRQPAPQLLLQAVHAPQELNLQGSGSSSSHGAVSCRGPVQGSPPNWGGRTTSRERNRWLLPAPEAGQWLHSRQAESSQSTGRSQAASQRLVSSSGPEQGSPHSLFVTSMARCLSHSPTHVGSCHSPQGANLQGLGSHFGWQLSTTGHALTLSCVPAHLLSGAPWKMKLREGLSSESLMTLFRMLVPEPQPALHAVDCDHSVHSQKAVFWHSLVQFETSLALFASQGLPQ